MGKEMQLTNDEYKVLMAYRHKEELDELQAALLRTVGLCAGRESITPEMVRRLTSDATAYDVLLTKCGFLEEFELEAEETAAGDEQEEVEEDTGGRTNAKL